MIVPVTPSRTVAEIQRESRETLLRFDEAIRRGWHMLFPNNLDAMERTGEYCGGRR